MQKIQEAYTFDDVLIVPSLSGVKPNKADVSTKITKKLKLNLPLISSAMDTVTESALAIKMAQSGGIGIIHKNLTLDEQANEVLSMCEHNHDASIGINWDVIIHTAEWMFPEENQNARSI